MINQKSKKHRFLILLGIFIFQISFSQNKTKEKLIEYLPSIEPGVTIRATIFIPSFEKNLLDTPQIIIRRKNDVWLEVYYRNKVKKDVTNDTCYISIFTEERRRYYEKAGMNADK